MSLTRLTVDLDAPNPRLAEAAESLHRSRERESVMLERVSNARMASDAAHQDLRVAEEDLNNVWVEQAAAEARYEVLAELDEEVVDE